ncbi:hypothetical protein LEP1GSC041_3951 [Leptospira noguchii str. 2006001870]|nr:hypothetical protein LEP1GSC041_3951 [Leptospira noguchii str. 2006001870]
MSLLFAPIFLRRTHVKQYRKFRVKMFDGQKDGVVMLLLKS